MKKIFGMMVFLFGILSLASCKYSSKNTSIGTVFTQNETTASFSFYELEGTYVIKFQGRKVKEGSISYTGMVTEGEITVYWVQSDVKCELFQLLPLETVASSGAYLYPGKTLYIILETKTKCKQGSFTFVLPE